MIGEGLKKQTTKCPQRNKPSTKSDIGLKNWLGLEVKEKWQETHQMKKIEKTDDIEFALEMWKISKMSKKT